MKIKNLNVKTNWEDAEERWRTALRNLSIITTDFSHTSPLTPSQTQQYEQAYQILAAMYKEVYGQDHRVISLPPEKK
ncbi:MAG: hypothetical protein WC975_16120 [Phycisphaerae bacterium]